MGIDHDFMTGKIEILEKQLEEQNKLNQALEEVIEGKFKAAIEQLLGKKSSEKELVLAVPQIEESKLPYQEPF